MIKTLAKNKGFTSMGLGMLVAGSFLHFVSALIQLLLPILSPHHNMMGMNDQMHSLPTLILSKGGLIHTGLVLIVCVVFSSLFLRWSESLNS